MGRSRKTRLSRNPKWTRRGIEAAKDFDVLHGCRGPDCIRLHLYRTTPKYMTVSDGDLLERPVPRVWDIFNFNADYNNAVHEELQARGIIGNFDELDFTPQRDDEGAPDDYDDIDAAKDALNAGYTLVKVPDAIGSKYWRLYVLDPWKPHGSPHGWFHAMKTKGTARKVTAAARPDLELINRHRRELGQTPLDPASSGWTTADIQDEAKRIRTLPNPKRKSKKARHKTGPTMLKADREALVLGLLIKYGERKLRGGHIGPGLITQDLVKQSGLSTSQVTNTLRSLERQGLVRKGTIGIIDHPGPRGGGRVSTKVRFWKVKAAA